MVRSFTLDGNEYQYVLFEELNPFDLPASCKKTSTYKNDRYKQSSFVDIGSGFDIETTKIPGSDYSTMYVWQWSFNYITVIGRTWDQFKEMCDIVKDRYHLDDKHKLLVYIHNMKFEWSFIKNQITWKDKDVKDSDGNVIGSKPDVFGLDYRTVIKATSIHNIEFRDSYVLTGMGLGKLAKNYKLGIEKLSGDLDYDVIRHFDSPLTDQELAYCINDVQILARFYTKYVKPEFIRKGYKVPLTSTGIIREELKRSFKALDTKTKNKLKRYIKKCMPSEETYKDLMEYVYRGGFTHANILRSNTLFEGDIMGSFDFKSSYPAVMLHEKMAWHFRKEDPNWFYKYGFDKKVLKNKSYFGEFKIYDVHATTPHSIESENKLIDYSDDAKFDNGRLMGASWIVVALTEQDVLNYLDFYSVTNMSQWTCISIQVGEKEELPHYLKDLILKYFYLKETIKDKESLEYALSKAKLNAFYGLCCTSIMFEDLTYNPVTGQMELSGNNQTYEKACSKMILLPYFGIWTSAIARRNLLKAFKKLGNDAVYGDTDSAKILNLFSNEYIFKDYNNVMKRLNKTMYVGEYDRDIFKRLGEFDFEGKIMRFKTLGCKRYCYDHIEYNKKTEKYELETTVKGAGMIKGSLQKYCDKYDLDIYEEFTDKLKLSPEDSDKLTSVYIDQPFSVSLTDFTGNTKIVSENSCVSLKPIEYTLKMSGAYLLTLLEMQLRYQRTGVACTVWR